MSLKIKWIGNAFFTLQTENKLLFVDPWIKNNKGVLMTMDEAFAMKPDYVLVTHGHPGHYGRGDSVEIANTVGCPYISTTEVVKYTLGKGLLKAPYIGMAPGSKIYLDGMEIELYSAKHPPIEIDPVWREVPGEPNGFYVIGIDGKVVMQVGDTEQDAVYEKVAQNHHVDVAMLPIKGGSDALKRDSEIITLLSIIDVVKPDKVLIHNRWKPERPAYEAFAKGIAGLALKSEIYPQMIGTEVLL